MSQVIVVTGWHGELWRCQAITARGRRCLKDAIIEGEHPLRKVRVCLCATHAAIVQAGAEIRLDNAAGYASIQLPAYGGTMDGRDGGITVPWDMAVGRIWMMQVEGAQLEMYECRAPAGSRPLHLQYIGPAVPTSAPGAPESGDVPSR